MLQASAQKYPDHPAFVSGLNTISYRELDAAADRVAGRLAVITAPGPVVVPLRITAVTAALYYGAIRAGRVVVPVSPLLPVSRLLLICEMVSAAGVAVGQGNDSLLLAEALPSATLLIELDPFLDLPAGNVPGTRTGERAAPVFAGDHRLDADAAQILLTSGTTGPPKAVELSHRAVKANAWQMSSAHEISHGSTVLCHLPMLNPMHTNAAVYQGATQVLCDSNDIEVAAALTEEHRVTHLYSQPIRLDRLARDPALANVQLPSVQYIAAGSRAIAADVVRTLEDRYGVYVFQGYGQTESCYLSHSDLPRSAQQGSVGYGLAQTETKVVGLDSGTELAPGQLGELQIRGPQLMNRYLNRPDLKPFTDDGWFHCGDVARMDPDGRVSIFDRLVDVGTRNGQLVSPSAVERQAEDDPEVREAGAVFIARDVDVELHLFVVLSDFESAPTPQVGPEDRADRQLGAEQRILARLNERLPLPQRVCGLAVVPALPRLNINGKVDRKELRKRASTTDCTCQLHDALRPVRAGT
jgi:long-chain acyl-CoA synthetase